MMCEITQPSPSTKYVHFLPLFPPTFHAVALASAEKTVISFTNSSAILQGSSVGAEGEHALCALKMRSTPEQPGCLGPSEGQ